MGGKHATTTSTVSVPKEVLARYNAVNARAETAASQPFKAFGNTASDYVAQMNAQQNAGVADINATAGSYQPYMTQATSATQAGMGPAYAGIDNYMSPYIKNVADTTGAMMRQQQEQAQSGALGTAAMSGAFGGDRAGIAAANLQQQNQMGYGKTMADIMNQGYTQALGASQADLARQLQGGSQMAQLGAQSQQLGLQGAQAKIAAGTMQQQTEQAGKDAMINRFMQEQGLPYQQAQFLANIAMGTGALSGSTTSTQTPRNWMGFEQGGRVDGYAGGGIVGPMEYSKASIGGQSYVPEANLPVGELMIAEPPQDQGGGGQQAMQMFQMAMGAARGGVIGANHGYASGGVAGYRHGYAGGGGPAAWHQGLGQAHVTPIDAETATATQTPNVAPPEDLPRLTFGSAAHTSGSPVSPTGVVPQQPAATANANLPLSAGLSPVQHVEPSPIQPAAGLAPAHQPNKRDADLAEAARRESGNDADALYGFANREGGPFAGTKITNMTVDQAIDFAKPGGAYANYSLDKLGRVATPMGKWQIVGRTLQQAKDDMGLTGNEIMTEDLQKRIAEHLYDTSGLSPWASSMGGGDGTGLAGGEKPYEQRNAVGKFFHNPSGGMNRNATLAFLAGLGHAVEAPTISPIGAILSGIGYGAGKYQDLMKSSADITKANIENTNALQSAWMRARALGQTNMTMEEFARSQGMQGATPFSGGSGANATTSGTGDSYLGAPFDLFGSGMRQKISLDGHEVYAGQSLDWLQKYRNYLSSMSAANVDPNLIEQIDTAIANAKLSGGQITDSNGVGFTDPAVRANVFGAGNLATAAERTQQLSAEIPIMAGKTASEDQRIGELSDMASRIDNPGLISEKLIPLRRIAGELGLGEGASDEEILLKSLAKDAMSQLQEMGGDAATQGILQTQSASSFTPGNSKPAMAEILAVRAGLNEYNKALYGYLRNIKNADQNADLYAAELKFKSENSISKFVDAQRPIFQSKIVSPPIGPAPAGVDQATWDHMTPENRALFTNGAPQ